MRTTTDPFPAAGEIIARRRRALGIHQADLAHLLGVTQQAVSLWESGDRRFPPEHAGTVCLALNLLPDELHHPCWHCKGKPPLGYQCLECGRARQR